MDHGNVLAFKQEDIESEIKIRRRSLQTLTNTEHIKMEADRAFEEWKRFEFDTEIKAEKDKSEEEKSLDSEEAVLPEERKTQSVPDNSVVALSSQCSVCSAPAADHLHYGAISCYSCRCANSNS